MYQPGMSNEAIAEQVQRMGYVKEKITADSAEPKSIDRLRELGLKGIRKARKGKDSINNGIDFIQDYHIIIHPRCCCTGTDRNEAVFSLLQVLFCTLSLLHSICPTLPTYAAVLTSCNCHGYIKHPATASDNN